MTDTRTRRLSHVALHVLAALTSPICTCIYSTTCSCASLHGQHQHVYTSSSVWIPHSTSVAMH
ncbi:hypothetical protein PF005_g9394 [Phytophthora fragariae]|uniref:Uncharacterized protein n=1 Tax=Phytophthora fragariae TaxID=53985 RepID=A0A6A3SHX6_9STRA|nr:hypothetical protein PF003_g3465 [Phytophthora fragariae]KAE8939731.1 hypothetical protein PF009_g10436 [Phytophthora fragariae]KAE9011084.1 hypothetical protein PF011_g9529 [Phytophthora fragariae]KAE9117078.1 hypothetical protein PF010_g8736 [Phytophthora fragariae]KAE9117459.1 hypothetical protein PF007_g9283 [Phytophthora fragariae]